LKIRKKNEKQKHTTLSLHNRLVTKYQDPTADFLFVIITATSDGIQPFLKQVGPLTSCDRFKISQKSFKVALLSELSMSKTKKAQVL
jgi:hypothetical protein